MSAREQRSPATSLQRDINWTVLNVCEAPFFLFALHGAAPSENIPCIRILRLSEYVRPTRGPGSTVTQAECYRFERNDLWIRATNSHEQLSGSLG